MEYFLKKYKQFLCQIAIKAWWVMLGLVCYLQTTLASTDPFGSLTITPSQLQSKVGSSMSGTEEYSLIGGGVFLIVAAIFKLSEILSRDKNEKAQHGSAVVSIVVVVLVIFIGFLLIGLGWKGASASVNPS